jgi:diadenosine tetraphosphate (Ap4A) HIT family hydrolase
MDFEDLIDFIDNRMKMSHTCQPLMLRILVEAGGAATIRQLAHGFLSQDESQLRYYENGYPVTDGHTLVIPKRHAAEYFDLSGAERRDADRLLKFLKQQLFKKDPSLTGYNIGVNNGASAGQTIFHVHYHLIPRRDGDTENPRGGVRGVIPGKRSY